MRRSETAATNLDDRIEQSIAELGDLDAFLFHRIAFTQRYRVCQAPRPFRRAFRNLPSRQRACRFHPGGDNVGRSHRSRRKKHIMCGRSRSTISFALATSGSLFFSKRKHCAFDRRHSRMKSQHDARLHFSLFIRRFVFGIGFADQRQHGAIDSGARLDHVRNEFLFRFFVEIFERFAARVLVLRQIVIGPIRDAFQLLSAERKFVFDVVSSLWNKTRAPRRARRARAAVRAGSRCFR